MRGVFGSKTLRVSRESRVRGRRRRTNQLSRPPRHRRDVADSPVASQVKAILAAPDRGASIRVFLWDASRKRLHGIFRPDASEGDSADAPVVSSAFTSAPWTGVAPPPGKATASTKFPCQLRVAPVRAFEPLPATLAGSVLTFERPGCAGAPAYDLTAEQVATVSRLFMTRGA